MTGAYCPFSACLSPYTLKYRRQTVSSLNNSLYIFARLSPAILDREVNIKLLAKVDESLNWSFEPLQDNIVVKIGENTKVEYIGKNLTNETLTSTANFVASPDTIQPYLIKSECFCFIEQTLNSGESKIFTMVFFIDPSMDSDKNFNDLKELVFTYEFSEYKS